MSINMKALNSFLKEYNELSAKPNHNAQERSRMAFLMTACAGLRSGASIEEVDQEWREDAARRGGIKLPTVSEQPSIEARGWKSFGEQPERRDVEGDPVVRIGTYTGLGFFVPTACRDEAVWAMKAHDALVDEDVVTLIKRTTTPPLPIP